MTPQNHTPGRAPPRDPHAPPRDRFAVPHVSRWPDAVRSAELLRGSLVRCGPGVRPVGWPETPRVRLAALEPWLETHRIAVLLTAAWVWGAVRSPGWPLELSTPGRRRPNTFLPVAVQLHQYHYADGEIARLGEYTTTTRLRTACDLLRLTEDFARVHRVACRLLILGARLPAEGVSAALDRGPAPHRHRARARLAGL